MGIAVQEDVSAAIWHAVVREESGARIVVTVHIFQKDVLACVKENAGIRVVFHGRVPHLETLQVQILCRNHNRRGIHRSLGSAVAMVRACGHGEVRAVKNRTLARIGQVMDAVVVALAACREDDCRGHPVTLEKDGIAQVVDASAHPHGIARMHHGIRLVERGKGLVLCARAGIVAIGCHVIHGTEGLQRRERERECKYSTVPFFQAHVRLRELSQSTKKARAKPVLMNIH